MTIHSRLLQIPSSSSSDGWTTFNVTAPSGSGSSFAGAGTRIIYVSSSTGNDTTGNGTQATPYASISKGSSFLRANHDDWLLLLCGDTWTDDPLTIQAGSGMIVSPSWSTAGSHTVSGVQLLGYYGNQANGRPKIQVSVTFMGGNQAYKAINSGTDLNNIAWNGWNFYAYTRDPNNGAFVAGDATYACGAINSQVSGSNIIFEDNFFGYFGGSFSQTPFTVNSTLLDTFIFRRNVVQYNYLGGGESQGMYLSGINTFALIEENTWDHNGWLPAAWGVPNTGANVRNHNAYFAVYNTANFIVRGNIFANDAGMSELRPGGVIYNNLFTSSGPTMAGGLGPTTMTYNVVQDAGAALGTQAYCYNLTDAVPGCLIDHNIASNEFPGAKNDGADGFIVISGPNSNAGGGGDWGYNTTGNFTNGSPTITNVAQIGNNEGMCSFNFPAGIGILDGTVNIPANTTVVSSSFPAVNGGVGTITMSQNAIGTATGVVISKYSKNQTVSNNIAFGQFASAYAADTVAGITDFVPRSTIVSNNCYDPNGTNSGQPGEPFPAPTRSIGSYSTSIGGAGTIADFINKAVLQQKSNWQTSYMANAVNNYIRAGFNFPQL